MILQQPESKTVVIRLVKFYGNPIQISPLLETIVIAAARKTLRCKGKYGILYRTVMNRSVRFAHKGGERYGALVHPYDVLKKIELTITIGSRSSKLIWGTRTVRKDQKSTIGLQIINNSFY
mmetsp:Transcript_8139/g.17543  ORF Transcript_8139/g.17543 Transcript_8139/m.17543 type:complete len:121 (-) Transcript_8139:13-375(-)